MRQVTSEGMEREGVCEWKGRVCVDHRHHYSSSSANKRERERLGSGGRYTEKRERRH